MNVVEVSIDYGGRPLSLQTGKLAKQADSSVVCRYGDTVVLVSVVSAKTMKEGQDFFPLTVDFQERYYSAGRLPGGFFKREAKPSDVATLAARCIDRPIRPLFPEDYLCETNVTVTVLSTDNINEAVIAGMIATSAAIHISDIPWSGPIGACRVGQNSDGFICNVSQAELPTSFVDLLVAGVKTGVIMVEGSSKEVTEKTLIDAIDFSHAQMLPIIQLIEEFREKTGNRMKREYEKPLREETLKTEMRKFSFPLFKEAFSIREKLARYEALGTVKEKIKEKFTKAEPKDEAEEKRNDLVGIYIEELKAAFARELTISEKKRIDGRGYKDIRSISCETGLLPRVHGSGLFTRGETQVLAALTLGTSEDEQKIDSISGVYQKSFMLHYNFPPFSVGEARPLRPPGRREIGHGFLAERALSQIIPSKDKFPYTIRIVAEVLESNGSSSMASVCSGALAMMDAGIPIEKPVAGVAMGLIKEGEQYAVLTDILGDEDHLGDMDFKVCGSDIGITAFQMDLKIGGVSREIMEQALEQAREGRLFILAKMNETLSAPREGMSPFAPRIHTIKIKPDKVREVIGSGGKVIKSIIERTGVKIDIEDDGKINIASADEESAKKAIAIIEGIVEEAVPGKIYEGKVSRIAEFGAFVEIIPGTDGLVHISELDLHRVRRVEDVVKEGDIIRVKCLDVDSQGKIKLSRKALLSREEKPPVVPPAGGTPGAEKEKESSASENDFLLDYNKIQEATQKSAEERSEKPEPAPSRRPERYDRPERSTSDRSDRSERNDRSGGERERFERSDRGDRHDRDRGHDRSERDRGNDRDRSESRRESSGYYRRDEGGGRSHNNRDRHRGNSGGDREPRGDARDTREAREPRDARGGSDRDHRDRDNRDRDRGGERDRSSFRGPAASPVGPREPREGRQERNDRMERMEQLDRVERHDRTEKNHRNDENDWRDSRAFRVEAEEKFPRGGRRRDSNDDDFE